MAAKAAEAQLTKLKVQLTSESLTQKAGVATIRSELTQASLEAEADAILAKDGLLPELTSKRSRAKAEELASRLEIEEERLRISEESTKAQLAVQEAEVEKSRALLALKNRQVEGCRSARESVACCNRSVTS